MRRSAASVVMLAVLTVAGCSSGGLDAASSSGGGRSTTTPAAGGASSTPSPSTTPSSGAPATTGGDGAVTSASGEYSAGNSSGAAGPTAPAAPVLRGGEAGAYVLVSGGATTLTEVDAVSCGQDGSLTGDGVTLTAGARSLTITGSAAGTVTVAGSAELSAEGGTFRGATDTVAVAFSWVC